MKNDPHNTPAACPYYVRVCMAWQKFAIMCEDPFDPGGKGSVCVCKNTEKQRNDYRMAYCCNRWEDCPVAAANEKKYEEL